MNRRIIAASLLSAALLAAGTNVARAEKEKEDNEQKIDFKEAPKAVRKTLKREAGDVKIKSVDKEKLKGKTVFEADVKIDGHNYEIVVNADGLLISKTLDEDEKKSGDKKASANKDAEKEDSDKEDSDKKETKQKESKDKNESRARDMDFPTNGGRATLTG